MLVQQSGTYNVQFSAQIYRTNGGTNQHVDIWFAVNGLDLPYSDTKVTVANNGHFVVASWNYFVYLNAGDYVEIMWSTTASTIQLQSEIAGIHPDVPSTIATIYRIN